MFKKNKTLYITISSDKSQLNDLIDHLRIFDKLSPILAEQVVKNSKNTKVVTQDIGLRKVYQQFTSFLDEQKIIINPDVEYKKIDLEKIKQKIQEFEEKYLSYSKDIQVLKTEEEKHLKTIFLLGKLNGLQVSLDELFDCKFIVARLGKISVENSKKIKYYQNIPFVFENLGVENDICWCLYATSEHYERQVDNIFSSLLFDRIHLPGKIHEMPKEAVKTLENDISDINKQILQLKEEQLAYLEKEILELSYILKNLKVNDSYNESYKYVVDLNKRISISGYMDSEYLEELHEILNDDKINILALPSKEKEVKIFKKQVKL